MLASLNEPFLLSALLSDGVTTLYPQAKIYNSLGTLVQTVDINHLSGGLYQETFTPTVEGYFSVVYTFYTDVGRTIDANYDKMGENFEVSSLKTNIQRLLGLAHSDSVLDSQSFDVDGNLTYARLRCYDSRANAVLGTNTGLLFVYDVSATYTSGALTKYSILKST
jgi:hypothetical protein